MARASVGWMWASAVLVALALLAAACVHFVNVTYDDAFISFRYAENLAGGNGLVFNPGEHVEGYSNFAWTVLLALPVLLGAVKHELGMLVVAKLMGAAAALATVLLVACSSRRASATSRAELPLGALYLALLAPFALWAVAGLEAPLLGLWLCAVVLLGERERRRSFQGVPWSALALACAAITRPEPALLFFPLAALRYAEPAGPVRWQKAFYHAVVFGTPCSLLLLLRRSYYGQWLPNTYFAKLGGDPEAWQRGWEYLVRATTELGLLALLSTCCLVLWLARGWSRSCTVLLAMLGTHAFSVVYDGGDWMNGYRLVVPALPLVALLLQRAWGAGSKLGWEHLRLSALPAWVAPPHWSTAWNRWLQQAERWRRAPPNVAALLLVAVSLASGLGSYRHWLGAPGSGWQGVNLTRGSNFVVAFWMREHATLPGVLATGEAGIIPYYTRRPLLDLFGLMDPHIARLRGVRHRKFDASYALGKRPRYVLLQVNRFADGTIAGAQTYAQTLMYDARFLRDYRLLREFPESNLYARY